MMKINSAGQARGKLRLNTNPEDLRMIANRLEECAKSASSNQTVEIDVSAEPLIIAFEYHPVRQYLANVAINPLAESIRFDSDESLVN